MGSGITLCSDPCVGAGRQQDNDRQAVLIPRSSWFRPTGQEAGGRDEILGGLTDLEESNKSKREGADCIQLTEAEGWEPQDEVPS